jgi:hypothetical protein
MKTQRVSTLINVSTGVLWIIVVLSQLVAVQMMEFDPVRINCGGPRYVDPDTKLVWKGDSSVSVTKSYKTSKCHNRYVIIANTTKTMREIYCSNRFFKISADTTGSMLQPSFYTIPVLNTTASYIVRLHFAEVVRCTVVHLNQFRFLMWTYFWTNSTLLLTEISNSECAYNGCMDQRYVALE